MSLRDNFFDKVQKREGKWLWTGSVNNDGYPKIKDNGKLRLASHVSLELAGRGAPSEGGVVMHVDNNPRNIAPSNLRVGTQAQNLKQMRDEGRDRPRGVDQEPDVKQASWAGFIDEIEKLALPRYEREIRKGTIARGDVAPGVPELPGPLSAVSRKATRDALYAPAQTSPKDLELSRAVKGRLAPLQMQQAHHLVPGVSGSTNVVPGNIAGAYGTPHGPAVVGNPEVSGTFIRQVGSGPRGTLRAGRAQGMSLNPASHGSLRQVLGPSRPEDATLRFAVGQHELGEAAEIRRNVVRPYASHLGVEPILREQISVAGDPDAVRAMSRARQVHPDDAMVQKLIRRAGGTPDRPLAIGGRQQRAVERMLDRGVGGLTAGARQKAVMLHGQGFGVPYMPKHLGVDELSQLGAQFRGARGVKDKLRIGKESVKRLASLGRFVTKGRV